MSMLTETQAVELAQKHGTPMLLVDCGRLQRQVSELQTALPGVDLYYAVKAFPDATVVAQLNAMGVGFDIASSGEIAMLQKLHINPRITIHTHPIKKDRDIRDALRFGCTTFVVDNVEEIKKFRKYRHRVRLLLRISFRSKDAIVDLSKKFGCQVEDVPQLLETADEMGIRVKGFSFHVGSQCKTAEMHVHAIKACTDIFNRYQDQYPNLSLLDIGGGFPVNYSLDDATDMLNFCAPIREALTLVPDNIRVIAEPGRNLVAPIAKSISSVMGKTVRGGKTWYYLDDGVYGNYSGQLFDGVRYPVTTFKQGEIQSCVLAGPTCDSIDVIDDNIELPELEIGDLVVGHVMGAYTSATATHFNSIAPSQKIYINEQEIDQTVVYIA